MALDDRYIDLRHFTEVKNSDGTSENKPYSHVVISDKEPTDTSVLWLDTTDSVDAETLDNATIDAIYKSINRLTNRVNAVEERFTHGINLGGFSNNVKTIVATEPSLEPDVIVFEKELECNTDQNISGTITTKFYIENGWYIYSVNDVTCHEYKDGLGNLTGNKNVITVQTIKKYPDEKTIEFPYYEETKTINDIIRVFTKKPNLADIGIVQEHSNYDDIWDIVYSSQDTNHKLEVIDSNTTTISREFLTKDKETGEAKYSEYVEKTEYKNRIVNYSANSKNPNYKFFAESGENQIDIKSSENNPIKHEYKIVYNVVCDEERNDDGEIIKRTYTYKLNEFKEIFSYSQITPKKDEKGNEKDLNYFYTKNIYASTITYTDLENFTNTTAATNKSKDDVHTNIDASMFVDGELQIITKVSKQSYLYELVTPESGSEEQPYYIFKPSSDFTVEENVKTEVSDIISSEKTNAKHISVKTGKFSQLQQIRNQAILDPTTFPFQGSELLYTYDTNGLYIVNPETNQLVLLNTASGGKADLSNVDEIIYRPALGKSQVQNNYNNYPDNLDRTAESYIQKVNSSGDLVLYKNISKSLPTAPNQLYLQKLYINSFYCGGILSDEFSYNLCDYNFVELSNLTDADITLDGISLQYYDGIEWKVLPLEGTIKSQSTFLIRGAQCSVSNVSTTRINVPKGDMDWYDTTTHKLIKFRNSLESDNSAFLLIYGTDNEHSADIDTKKGIVPLGYIDLVGMGKNADYKEQATLADSSPNSNYIYVKYFTMDKVSQATKELAKRNNSLGKDWQYVDLSTADPITNINSVGVNILDYTPQPSSANKNLFYNKSKLEDKFNPELITCTLGFKATADNTSGATRCFNWVSKDYRDEYLYYKKIGNTNWECVESFKENSIDVPKKYQHSEYYRQRFVMTDNTPATAHKVVLQKLEAGTYQYCASRIKQDSSDKSSMPSDVDESTGIRTFKVKTNAECKKFSFVHITDQQGFNHDEYEVWRHSANFIKNNEKDSSDNSLFDFSINTGDMTQNGNRSNEWIDYFTAGKSMFEGHAQMACIGNNDLCGKHWQGFNNLGNGNADAFKINPINILLFYTFDYNTKRPVVTVNNTEFYINSLYSFDYGDVHFISVNSEISNATLICLAAGHENYSTEALETSRDVINTVINGIKTWCIDDLSSSLKTGKCNIAYCHEMPFTIITDDLIQITYSNNEGKDCRDGSRLNTVGNDKYWFSRLLELANVKLCLGGHKHTYSLSYPIRENYEFKLTEDSEISSNTYINGYSDSSKTYSSQNLNLGEIHKALKNSSITLGDVFESIKITKNISMKPIIQHTNAEVIKDNTLEPKDKDGNIIGKALSLHVDEIIEDSTNPTAPVYCMLQATGYKHTSNKELPSSSIPWLKRYYPNNGGKVNPQQQYPFYGVWTIDTDTSTDNPNMSITGEIYKIGGIFSIDSNTGISDGIFNINNANINPYKLLANGAVAEDEKSNFYSTKPSSYDNNGFTGMEKITIKFK